MTRINTKRAAEILGLSDNAVREFAKKGWLAGVTNSGERGQGKGFYFDQDEVEAFARGGKPAAEAYRASREVNGKPKRGRRVAAR